MRARFRLTDVCGWSGLSAALLALAVSCGAGSAQGFTLKTLHVFCRDGSPCDDGQNPSGALTMDAAGNLYGTALSGGANDQGTVFELIPNADKSKWTFVKLHDFCQQDACMDGAQPVGKMVVDVQGNLFGEAHGGFRDGIVYELSPSQNRTGWTYKVLVDLNDLSGWRPFGGLTYAGATAGAPYDGVSPLFGTTETNAEESGPGLAFEVSPQDGNWTGSAIYNFCGDQDCSKGGSASFAPLTGDGHWLYGTTNAGGRDNNGVIFKLGFDKANQQWTEKVVHSFCQTCTRQGFGHSPGVILDREGDLFGASEGEVAPAYGTVYEIPAGGKYRILKKFCSSQNCADGRQPEGPLTLDGANNLFGTTQYGGARDMGTVYELNGAFTQIYSFCAKSACADGSQPLGGVIPDSAGDLFGTASTGGGTAGSGTVFELAP